MAIQHIKSEQLPDSIPSEEEFDEDEEMDMIEADEDVIIEKFIPEETEEKFKAAKPPRPLGHSKYTSYSGTYNSPFDSFGNKPKPTPFDKDLYSVLNAAEKTVNKPNTIGRLIYIKRGEDVRVALLSSYNNIVTQSSKGVGSLTPLGNLNIEREVDNILYQHDAYGNLINHKSIDASLRKSYTIENYSDFFTGEDLTPYLRERGYIEEPVIEKRPLMTSEMIGLIRRAPRQYKNKFIDKQSTSIDDGLRETRLISTLLLTPGDFDENFTIVENEPKSFKMKQYLDKLAAKVSEEIEKTDEISDLDLLKKQTYDEIGFKESFESIVEAAEEFEEYFKYMLVKDEKIIINRTEFELLSAAAEELKNSSYFDRLMKKMGDKVLVKKEMIATSKKLEAYPFALSSAPDVLRLARNSKTLIVTKIVKTDSTLISFPESLSSLGIDIETAIINECLESKYTSELANKWKVQFNFLVIDRYNSIYEFSLKAGTLAKWTKKLNEELDKVTWHVLNNAYNLPWEFHNVSMTI